MEAFRASGEIAAAPGSDGRTVAVYLDELFRVYRAAGVFSEKEDRRVLLAEHGTIGNKLVVRCLPRSLPVYDLLCSIRHPNLPAVYDAVKLSDGEIILEEYIRGVNVAEVLKTGLYTYSGAARVLSSVCSALSVLHQKGFVHRDVKPENVMISDNGVCKLIDFDAARFFDTAKTGDTIALGTVGFAPPEQFGITQSDPRSDIYALGVLLNVMLTGKHPSEKIVGGKAGRIVLRCTQISPEKRFETAAALKKAL